MISEHLEAAAIHDSDCESEMERIALSSAISLRRIADALDALGTPTMVVNNSTLFRELSPEEIIRAMRDAGQEPPDVTTGPLTRLGGDDQS